MRECPKCGYLRKPEDNEFYGPDECPKCGTIYIKYQAYLAQTQEDEEAKEEPPEDVHKEPEGPSRKTCSKCGKISDSYLFDLLPWRCPACNTRSWDSPINKRQNAFLYTAIALGIAAILAIGMLDIQSRGKRRQISQQEQAEKLTVQQDKEAARKRAEQELAAKLQAQAEINELIKKESLAAYNALKKIDALLLNGSTYGDYSSALADARKELDVLKPAYEQTSHLESIFAYYNQAKDVWYFKRTADLPKLCEAYKSIIYESEFAGKLKDCETCLRSCDTIVGIDDRVKRQEVFQTIKPYIEELQQTLWSEAAISMRAFEQRWGFP
jgi:DNA-directed RNA polymerase subunit M/transcription elongation factor TFIIS